MKSPWKYLAELASLGRAAKQPEAPRETEASTLTGPMDLIRAAEDREDDVSRPAAEAMSVRSSTFDNLPPNIAGVPLNREPATSSADPPGLDDHRTLPSQPASAKPQRRTRKTSAKNVVQANSAEYGEVNSSVAPSATFYEEVAASDEELKRMRRQLADKLRLQNKQLKKLLERFDAS